MASQRQIQWDRVFLTGRLRPFFLRGSDRPGEEVAVREPKLTGRATKRGPCHWAHQSCGGCERAGSGAAPQRPGRGWATRPLPGACGGTGRPGAALCLEWHPGGWLAAGGQPACVALRAKLGAHPATDTIVLGTGGLRLHTACWWPLLWLSPQSEVEQMKTLRPTGR